MTSGLPDLSAIRERAESVCVTILASGRIVDNGWWCLVKESEIAQLSGYLDSLLSAAAQAEAERDDWKAIQREFKVEAERQIAYAQACEQDADEWRAKCETALESAALNAEEARQAEASTDYWHGRFNALHGTRAAAVATVWDSERPRA